jgi:hypothetical protein
MRRFGALAGGEYEREAIATATESDDVLITA